MVKYHGSLAEREEIRERLRASLPNTKNRRFLNTKPLDVVLTTFSYFSSEKSEDRYVTNENIESHQCHWNVCAYMLSKQQTRYFPWVSQIVFEEIPF